MGRPCKMLQLARPCHHAQLASPSNLEGLAGNSKGFPGRHSALHWTCPVSLARLCESWVQMLHLAHCWAWQSLASHGKMLHHIGACCALHSLVSHGKAFARPCKMPSPTRHGNSCGDLARSCNLQGLAGMQSLQALPTWKALQAAARASQADTHPCTGHALCHLQDLVSHGDTCCTLHPAGHGKALQVMGRCCITLELAGPCTAL